MEGKRKSCDNDGQPETKQARSETTRTSDVSSGEHSVEMDTAEIGETGDLSAGIISKGSQREHASDSTESSSSESELEREKERLLAEDKRLTRSCRKQQLRAEINELQASVENKKVKKQSFLFGMEVKSKRSDIDKRPETTPARLDSLPEAIRTSYVSSVTGMSGGNAENCNITGQSIQEYHTCNHLQDLFSETELKINSMDASKHVSTHAQDAAYKHLKEQGCVIIKGRSGSGKTHMGYTLLQRASKQFTRKPVKISSPHEWNYLPKLSSPKSDLAIDKYVVMIDDIFGSTNLIQHNLDQWRQKFDLVWPQVESGQIWLVITSRPEIIGQIESSFRRYDIFTSSRSILLDEKLHCLTEDEKLEFLDKLCGKYIAYKERIGIARTETALGFPQCCMYFASHKHIRERGLVFFHQPFEFIKQEIDSVKRSQKDSYCVLLMVLAYDGCLKKRLVKTSSPSEEFTSRCKQMMRVSGLKEEPNMKEILQSLCGAYLVSDGNCYQFSHRSIHDVLFVDLCESCPDLGITMGTPSMLVEYIRTTGLKSDMLNVVVLDKEDYPTLANKLREYLSNKDSRYVVLSHPSLNDKKIVDLFLGWDTRRISLQRGKNMYSGLKKCQYRSSEICYKDAKSSEKLAEVMYSYFLSRVIMNGMARFAEYIMDQFSAGTDAETQPMLDEALVCAVFIGHNHIVNLLLKKGAQPSRKAFDVLSVSPELDFGTNSKLVKMVNPKEDCLKPPFLMAVMFCNVTFLRSVIGMCTKNMKHHKYFYSKSISYLITELNELSTLTEYNLFKAVDVMSLLHNAGGSMDLDDMLILASHKDAQDKLIAFIHTVFQIPSSCHDDMQSSVCHSKKFHQLLESLIDKLAPVQMKDKTVKTLLHKAARYQCKECINILLSDDVEETDSDGNTALHCMIKSLENHDHEVLELLMDKTNHRHIKNKRGELPLHIAARRQCQECISHLLMETDVSKDHAGIPVHCTCDEGASYQRDESHEHVCKKSPVRKGSDVTIKTNTGQTTKIQCKKSGEHDFHVKDQDETGNTALHYLTHGKSCFDETKEHIDHETYQLFIDKGADVGIKNMEGQTVLHMAAKANCKQCVETLLPKSDVNSQDEAGNTPVHYLTHNESYDGRKECLVHETFQLFIDKKADVGIKNKEGQTVLHVAANANCKICVETLIPKSDVNCQDEAGDTPLHYLTHKESYDERKECLVHETYQLFIDKGADVGIKNMEGQTVLHMAAYADCKICVETLLPKSDVNSQDEAGNTPLHYLTHNESYDGRNKCLVHETYQLFIDKGADVHIKNKERQTVLHMAAKAHCKQCVETLLPLFDVQINAQDEMGNTPLHALMHNESYDGRKECLVHETYQLFIDKGADVHIKNKKGQTVLHMAAKANCKQCVETLLPLFDVHINAQDEMGNTPLHALMHKDTYHDQLCDVGSEECLAHETYRLFIDKGADVHIKNKEGQTVLHMAAKANCKQCVEMLLRLLYVHINAQDEMGNTPLHSLKHNESYDGRKECLAHETYQLFIDKGADVGIKNKKGQTVLHMAAKANCKKCFEFLLPKLDRNCQDVDGNTALHYLHHDLCLVRKNECLIHETYRLFIDKGAGVGIKNKEGQTVLHMAAKANCKHCVERLLPLFDVQINAQDEMGNTPLHALMHKETYHDQLCDVGSEECLDHETYQLFIDNGADVGIKNKKGQTVLHMAAEANCKKVVERLLPLLDVNSQDEAGNTPLHSFTHKESYDGRKECLAHETYQLFIVKGADVHIKNKEGQTLLHMAAKANCKKCVKMLLPLLDVNAKDEMGNTVLHSLSHNKSLFCFQMGHERMECLAHETCQLFLKHKGDVHIKNEKGQTVLHMAAKAYCQTCVETLLPMFDINCQDENGNTALHHLTHNSESFRVLKCHECEECLAFDICQLFIDKGADVHIKNKKGQTVLHMAATAHCKKCVEKWLPLSDVNCQDGLGNTALHNLTQEEPLFYELCNYGERNSFAHETCQLFIDKGANVHIKNKEGQTVLHMAAKVHCRKCVEKLLPLSDVNCQDGVGNTALHHFTQNKSYFYEKYDVGSEICLDNEIYQLFIDKGADIHMKNKEGKTVLHMATKANCLKCLETLLAKSDVNAQDEAGNTPLHSLTHKELYDGRKECLVHETYQLFIDNGADVGIKNMEGQTVLHMAAEANCKRCVETLLPKSDVNSQDEAGNTPLHSFTHNESYDGRKECLVHETFQLFIDKGADVGIKNMEGETVLHMAAEANCKICVETLLPKSDVNSQDEAGNTPLHSFTHNESYDGRKECLVHETYQLFIVKGADVHIKNKKGQTVLHMAAKANCKQCVEMLLRLLYVHINAQDEMGNTPLHTLKHKKSYDGRKECLIYETYQLFIDKGADVGIKNKKGQTVLHMAAKANCKQCVEMLLPLLYVHINAQDEMGNTPLHTLKHKKSYDGRKECLIYETYQLFIDKGADVGIKNKKGQTVLHMAAKGNCKQCVEMLLPLFYVHINAQDEMGNTPLHSLKHKKSYDGRNKCLAHETYRLFIDKGADVGIKNKKGQTVLHMAAKANCKQCAERLLPLFDVQINAQDEMGNTPLHALMHKETYHDQLCDVGSEECLDHETYQLFIDNGADVGIKNKKGQTVLHMAAEANCKKVVERLLPLLDVNSQDEAGNTPLHSFTHKESYDGRKECLAHETYQLFIVKGADVHIKNKKGQTLLHMAAKANCKKCVKMLLPLLDVNAKDEMGNTVLHSLTHNESLFCFQMGHERMECLAHETCQLFLKHKGDVHIKNEKGQTVLHMAAKAYCQTCVETLLPMFDINCKDEMGNTALHHLTHNSESFRVLKCHECEECLAFDICQLFIDKGADVHIKNKEGQTVLHMAATAHCKKCVEKWLPLSDVNCQDGLGNTALHNLTQEEPSFYELCNYGEKNSFAHGTCQLFIDKGANVHIKNKEGQTVLHMAAKVHCRKCVEKLLPLSDVNCQDGVGNTALHHFTQTKTYFYEKYDVGSEKCLDNDIYQLFIDKGADIHMKNKEGKTVLHMATKANCLKCLETLLAKSDVNAQDEAGNTPLHSLTHKESYDGRKECLVHETYQLFIDNGADVGIKNMEGQTVLHMAAKANCKQCVEKLLPLFDVHINAEDEMANTPLHSLKHNNRLTD